MDQFVDKYIRDAKERILKDRYPWDIDIFARQWGLKYDTIRAQLMEAGLTIFYSGIIIEYAFYFDVEDEFRRNVWLSVNQQT